MMGRFDEATAVLEESIRHAEAAPADAGRAQARRSSSCAFAPARDGWRPDTVEQEIEATIGDLRARPATRRGSRWHGASLAWAAGTACRFGDAAEASRHAIEHARRAGDVRQERRAATAYAAAAALGPTLVDEAIDRCEAAIEQTGGRSPVGGALLAVLAGLYAMQGEFDHARVARGARAGRSSRSSGSQMETARARDGRRSDRAAGRQPRGGRARAPVGLRRSRRRRREVLALSTVAGFLAQTLLEQGALEEASAFCDRSRELTTEADIATQALWRYVRGTDPRPAGRGRRGGGDRPRGDRAARGDRRDRVPDRGSSRARRGPRRRRPDRRGARRLRERARLAEKKGGVVILTGVLRQLEDLDAARTT